MMVRASVVLTLVACFGPISGLTSVSATAQSDYPRSFNFDMRSITSGTPSERCPFWPESRESRAANQTNAAKTKICIQTIEQISSRDGSDFHKRIESAFNGCEYGEDLKNLEGYQGKKKLFEIKPPSEWTIADMATVVVYTMDCKRKHRSYRGPFLPGEPRTPSGFNQALAIMDEVEQVWTRFASDVARARANRNGDGPTGREPQATSLASRGPASNVDRDAQITGGFDREPDQFNEAINGAFKSVGLTDQLAAGSCRTTKLYRGCEFRYGNLVVTVTGPIGGGSGTNKILVVNESGSMDRSFGDLTGAIMAAYAPALSREQRIEVAESLVSGMRGSDRKGERTVGGVYFSMMQVGGEIHFHAMRE